VISSIQITGLYFSVTGGTCTTDPQVGANSSCQVQVTYAPGGCFSSSGALTIYDNASNSPQTVNLTGRAKACTLVVTPGSQP
jgi:hypothetical protein